MHLLYSVLYMYSMYIHTCALYVYITYTIFYIYEYVYVPMNAYSTYTIKLISTGWLATDISFHPNLKRQCHELFTAGFCTKRSHPGPYFWYPKAAVRIYLRFAEIAEFEDGPAVWPIEGSNFGADYSKSMDGLGIGYYSTISTFSSTVLASKPFWPKSPPPWYPPWPSRCQIQSCGQLVQQICLHIFQLVRASSARPNNTNSPTPPARHRGEISREPKRIKQPHCSTKHCKLPVLQGCLFDGRPSGIILFSTNSRWFFTFLRIFCICF